MLKYFSMLLFFVSSLSAQDSAAYHFNFQDSTYVIADIVILGNETTKDYIVTKELSLKKGNLLTYEQLKYDIDRVYSLKLFTKVNPEVVPLDSTSATLFIMVRERWYFYPYPVIGYRERDWKKLYYGLGVAHTNFTGRNVRIFSEFALGYDPYVMANYYNPLINVEHAISFSFFGYYKEQHNRSLVSKGTGPNFFEKIYSLSLGAGKRFSLYSTSNISFEFLRLSVDDNKLGRTLSTSGIDQFFSMKISYAYDTRDFREYPRVGTLFSVGVSKVGLFHSEVDFQRVGLDFRRFIPMYFDIVAAGRMFGSAAWGGRITNYSHVYFGYGERIRGYFNSILEGEQQIGLTAEIHFPVLKPRYFHIEYIPFEQFRDIRYAVNFAAFADAGNTRYRTEPLALTRFYSGYGVGIHFLFAYSAVLRVEYALPYGASKKSGEFIFDIGAAL